MIMIKSLERSMSRSS